MKRRSRRKEGSKFFEITYPFTAHPDFGQLPFFIVLEKTKNKKQKKLGLAK